MIGASIDTKEVESWLDNEPKRTLAAKQMLIIVKNEAVEKIMEEADDHSTSGELERSIIGKVTGFIAEIYGNVYSDIVLEYGRSPGKMPPIEPLQEWAGRRLGNPKLGYFIAKKIATQGTQKYRRKGPKQLSSIEDYLQNDFIPNSLVKLADEYTK